MPAYDENDKEAESARQMFKIIKELSDILETNLDSGTLRYCIRLCENGVNPETLATIVLDLQNEVRHHEARKRFSYNGSDNLTES